jgi:putative N6-adenine-specific DNA methylase
MMRLAVEHKLDRSAAPIIGSDISRSALQLAGKNATRAGVGGMISFVSGDIADIVPPPPPGILIFNPPYGVRMGEEEKLGQLYRNIGDALKRRFAGYTAYLFTGSPRLAGSVGLKASRRIVLFNGPIECRLLRYELY